MKIIIISLITVLITGCTYYQAAPGDYYTRTTTTTSKFDQSWSAASGALVDQGVYITTQNRDAGILQGTRGGTKVTVNIRNQADGSVRVEFDTSGSNKHDPTLIDRINSSYSTRMGR